MPGLQVNVTPHDYQCRFHEDAFKWIEGDVEDGAKPGDRRLYASPTGTGKSVMALMLLHDLPNAVLITPRLEIIAGMLNKGGVNTKGWSDEKLAEEALSCRITTPVRFRNMLAKGTFPFAVHQVIIDEAHHDLANTYSELQAYLGQVVWIGLTATPFRGTPKGTQELLEKWGGVTNVLTMAQAVERGCLSVPVPQVWPLVDDDTVTISNGEFVVAALDAAVTQSLDEVVRRCGQFGRERLDVTTTENVRYIGGSWDRPTLFACPTTITCHLLAERLNDAGLPADVVVQDTPRSERNRIFAAAMLGETAVVQIDVVSEGVDLPFRRLIDLRPTMSPVKWMQQVGRITRPIASGILPVDVNAESYGPARIAEPLPEYYYCNRNLERHGYLFNGAMPPSYIAEAQQAFAKPTNRVAARAFGLENIGRFAAAELPMLDGCIGSMYMLVSVDKFAKTEYAAIIHPAVSDVLYARRVSTRGDDGQFKWGKWAHIDAIPDLQGFGSAPAKTLTDKQAAWWVRSAQRLGLDPSVAKVNKRNFAALPLLTDLGFKLRA